MRRQKTTEPPSFTTPVTGPMTSPLVGRAMGRLTLLLTALSLLIGSQALHALDIEMENDLLMFGGVTSVTITGPDGFHFTSDNPEEVAFITLDQIGILQDGVYRYSAEEIVLGDTVTVTDPDNGRAETERRIVRNLLKKNGTFRVKNGLIVNPDKEES